MLFSNVPKFFVNADSTRFNNEESFILRYLFIRRTGESTADTAAMTALQKTQNSFITNAETEEKYTTDPSTSAIAS